MRVPIWVSCQDPERVSVSIEEEWLWGWDPVPAIVSVWADADGHAFVWRRPLPDRVLVREEVRFRPWILLSTMVDLEHLGEALQRERRGQASRGFTYRELSGPGALRFLVRADDGRALARAVLYGARRRLGRHLGQLRDLGADAVLVLAPEEQYLVASGRTYFRDLAFDELHRLQFDLETTGLDPEQSRIFLIAVRDNAGKVDTLESPSDDDEGERDLLERFAIFVREADPDVIENHNLHGFDLPFLVRRAEILGVSVDLGRLDVAGFRKRASARSSPILRRARYTVPGRELIDTLDAVIRHDFSARDLPGRGLKVVARHFGLSREDREQIPGAEVHDVFRRDPDRVRRYARADVEEAGALARLLGGSAFALARMAPRRYERCADAGAATGVLDPLLVRAYLRVGAALPAHEAGDGTAHSGAALHLFASGVARRIVKADVASLYPSLMREYRIGPRRDRLGVLITLVDRLVDQRLAAKAAARLAPPGSQERFTHEAVSAAMKIVVNSAYGYLGAAGLTRFSDVHAANEVTRHGREVLDLLCRELARRDVTLLEADTDGVYFSVPDAWTEEDERRVVDEVAALLPARVKLEFDGRYEAMLSHEPKNYALKPYGAAVVLKGVAFRSSRAEPFGEAFLRRAITALLDGDIVGVKTAYTTTLRALRRREMPTRDVAARVRLTKTPEQYLSSRAQRRELPYEALLRSGRSSWIAGEAIKVYRVKGGEAGLFAEGDLEEGGVGNERTPSETRDYDVDYYARLLRETYAARLVRALSRDIFDSVFSDPDRPSLFPVSLVGARPILTILSDPLE